MARSYFPIENLYSDEVHIYFEKHFIELNQVQFLHKILGIL